MTMEAGMTQSLLRKPLRQKSLETSSIDNNQNEIYIYILIPQHETDTYSAMEVSKGIWLLFLHHLDVPHFDGRLSTSPPPE